MSETFSWDEEEFEEAVARGLIACFETRIAKNRGVPPSGRITQAEFDLMRRIGPFFPSNDRLVMDGPIDIDNDGWPQTGLIAMIDREGLYGFDVPCFRAVLFRPADRMPRGWKRTAPGRLYENIQFISPDSGGIYGESHYVQVAPSGAIVPADFPVFLGVRGGDPYYMRNKLVRPSKDTMRNHAFMSSVAMQFWADRRFAWAIRAQEQTAKVTLGCVKEEIKSLLYARDLPLTATGRKRPILHLVAAHRRRIKAGIDVDVTAFLRGEQHVDIHGTRFSVLPPTVLRPEVSLPSQRKYYEERTTA